MDNGSGDDTVNIINGLAARHDTPLTLDHCPTPGANHARNRGFGLARGDFIQWLDADDALHPEKIARQVAALQHHPPATVAYGDWRWRFPLPAEDWRTAAQTIAANATAVAYGQRRWVIPRTLESYARLVAHGIPALWERHLDIMRLLDGFARMGVLRPVDPPGPLRKG